GFWDLGSRTLDCWMLDVGLLDVGCWMLACWLVGLLDVGCSSAEIASGPRRSAAVQVSMDQHAKPGRGFPPVPAPRTRPVRAHRENLRGAAGPICRMGRAARVERLEVGRVVAS